MKNKIPFLIVVIIFFSCRKPTENLTENVDLPISCDCDYTSFTDPNYDYILESLNYDSPVGIPVEYIDDYSYTSPVFNPNNSCQIAYVKINNMLEFPSLVREIWKFDFDTGESTMIADNFYYNLNWGSNGWLIYTGVGHQVYKVKPNGDSLIQMTDNGIFNRVGKWNETSSLYFINRDWGVPNEGYSVYDSEGDFYHLIEDHSFFPNDWINDSTLFGLGPGWRFYQMTLPSENMTQLCNLGLYSGGSYILDRENMTCYTYFCYDMDCYYSRFDLSGSNTVDTLKLWYDSYHFVDKQEVNRLGDIFNNKFIITLNRDAQNTPSDITIDRRENIIIMDLDCNNERMVVIPE